MLLKRSVYDHAIGCNGSAVWWRGNRWVGVYDQHDPFPRSVRADLRHFLFPGYFAATKTRKAAEGIIGGSEEGRQGRHGVGDLGYRDESREGDGDIADRGYDEDSHTTGSDSPITRWRRR